MRKKIAATGGTSLPADIASGPDPKLWPSPRDWTKAGEAWSREHLGRPTGWRKLLPKEVAYAVSPLGRHQARVDPDYRRPWEPARRG